VIRISLLAPVVLILAALVASTIAAMLRARPSRRVALVVGGAALLIFLAHALVEGLRWQMVPAYLLLALGAGALTLRALRPPPARTAARTTRQRQESSGGRARRPAASSSSRTCAWAAAPAARCARAAR